MEHGDAVLCRGYVEPDVVVVKPRTLRESVLLLLAVAAVLSVAGPLAHQRWAGRPRVDSLDRSLALDAAGRVRTLLMQRQDTVNALCRDWAHWDDMYRFAETGDPSFVDLNFGESFEAIEISLISVVRPGGEVVWQRLRDATGRDVELAEFPADRWPVNHPLLTACESSAGVEGTVVTALGPLLFAVQEISDSAWTAPPNGHVVMGRWLDSRALQELAPRGAADLRLTTAAGAGLSGAAWDRLGEGPGDGAHWVEPVSPGWNRAWLFVRPHRAVAPVVIVLDAVRENSQTFLATQRSSLQAATLMAAVIMLVTLLTLRRLILRPLGDLSAKVDLVTSQGNLSLRTAVAGAAEIRTLSAGFNQMLDRVQREMEARRVSEERHRRALALADAVPYEFDIQGGRYLFVGEGIERLTGYSREEFDHAVWRSLLREVVITGPEAGRPAREVHARALAGEMKEWRADYRICTRAGAERWLSDCSIHLCDDSGRTVGSVGFLQDITERHRRDVEQDALRRLSQLLTEPLTLNRLGEIVARESRALFSHDAFFFAGVDAQSQTLFSIRAEDTPAGGHAPERVTIPRMTHPLGASLVADGQPKLINRETGVDGTAKTMPFGCVDRQSMSIMSAPVLWEGATIGVISTQSYSPRRYGEREFALFQSFTGIVAGALARLRIEESLHERDQTIQALYEAMPDMVVRLSAEGVFLDIRPSPCFPLYRPVEEALGRSLREVMPPEFAAFAEQHHASALQTGEPQSYEFQLPSGSEIRDFEARVAVSGASELLVIVRDITHRKRAEAARESLRRLAQRLNEPLSLRQIGRVIAEESRRLFGHDFLGLTVFDSTQGMSIEVVNEDTPLGAAGPVEFPTPSRPIEFYRTGSLIEVFEGRPVLINRETEPSPEGLRLTGDKSRISRSLMSVPISWEGSTVGFLSVQSYTPGRYGESDLALLETFGSHCGAALTRSLLNERGRRLAAAIEQASDSIVIMDRHGRLLYVNPAFEQLTGRTREEILSKRRSEVLDDQSAPDLPGPAGQLALDGKPWRGRVTTRRGDGSTVEEDVMIAPLRGETGEVTDFVEIRRDVTRESQLETQLRQAQKMEAIGQLAGGVAHDFNNLLQGILGFTELALDSAGDPDTFRGSLQEVRRAAERAADLTRQLLAFSRKQVIQLSDLSVEDLIRGLMKMLRRLIPENIEIILSAREDIALIRADPGQIEQVIINLAVNARDAMSGGGRLLIEVENFTLHDDLRPALADLAPGPYVRVSVSDTGMGMPPDVRARVFEPFFTTKEMGKGTGLGLSTVYGIVRQHEGTINVYSEPGVGSTFRVYLPAAANGGDAAAGAESLAGTLHGTETILVAEDEEMVRALTVKALERHGYRVLQASNGEEAVAVCEAHAGEIDLVLMDSVMPKMSGRRAWEQIRARRPGGRVLFASGYSGPAADQEYLSRNSIPFLSKPYHLAELLRRIRDLIDASPPPAP